MRDEEELRGTQILGHKQIKKVLSCLLRPSVQIENY
jgi:hypothetical protein